MFTLQCMNRDINKYYGGFFVYFVFLVCFFGNTSAQIQQMMFDRIDTSKGLGDDRVYHVLQLRDGRMAITTHDVISVYDALNFHNIDVTSDKGMALSAYDGAYHCYNGMHNRLWIKDNHCVKCLDVSRLTFVKDCKSLIEGMTGVTDIVDVFCDLEGRLWCVTSDNRLVSEEKAVVRLPESGDVLLDVIDDKDILYLFYNSTKVVAVEKGSGRVSYSVCAFEGMTVSTSLVVRSGTGRFYQLVNYFDATGKPVGRCLCFDTKSRAWSVVFDVPYTVHTIAVDSDVAYVTTKEDMWCIDCKTNTACIVESLMLSGTPILTRHMNTIFVDNQHGVWLGSYSNGLLYSHPSHRTIENGRAIGLEEYAEGQGKHFLNYRLMPMLVEASVDGVVLGTGKEGDCCTFMDTLCLSCDYNNVVLTFNALNYPQPHLTKYYLRYLDRDSVWCVPEDLGASVDGNGSLVVNLPRLESGMHQLEVKAVIGNVSSVCMLHLLVERSWKADIPFYLILIIVIIHLLLALFFLFVEHGKDVPETSMDERDQLFVDKVTELVNANMSKNGYGVEQLSADLCMERTGLYKKMNAIMGCTPSTFIRKARLKRAAELLCDEKMNVQEVAEATGFNSASYMSRCFVSEFGCSPVEYVKRQEA